MDEDIIFRSQLSLTLIVFPLLILFAFLLLVLQPVFSEIETYFSWAPNKIYDWELTYAIDSKDRNFHKLVDNAMLDWTRALGVMSFTKSGNIDTANIYFQQVDSDTMAENAGNTKDGKEIAAHTSPNGPSTAVTSVDIHIVDWLSSEEKFKVLKHEIGHALGLGHDVYEYGLMNKDPNRKNNEIGECEKYMVFWTNGLDSYVYDSNYRWDINEQCIGSGLDREGDENGQWNDNDEANAANNNDDFYQNFELTVRLIGDKEGIFDFTVTAANQQTVYIENKEFEDDGKAKVKFFLDKNSLYETEIVCITDVSNNLETCNNFDTYNNDGATVDFYVN